jgi:hypothetical protein
VSKPGVAGVPNLIPPRKCMGEGRIEVENPREAGRVWKSLEWSK